MSRTKPRGKAPGYDYWSRRPGTRKASTPGRFAKTVNVRAERRAARREARDGESRD